MQIKKKRYLSVKFAKGFKNTWKSRYVYHKKGWIIYLRSTDFTFVPNVLRFCSLVKTRNEVKGPRVSSWEREMLPSVHHGCYWIFCTVIPYPLEMIGSEALQQCKEGSILSSHSLTLIAVQTASLLTWTFCWQGIDTWTEELFPPARIAFKHTVNACSFVAQ